MIVKLIEAKRSGGTLALEEVFVNTEHVTCVRAAAPPTLYEGQLPEGLDKRTEFCKVFLDHGQKYIKLKDREIDLLLLKLLTIYVDYDLCEALLLIILTTEMGEA
jgi:hypothetical protein